MVPSSSSQKPVGHPGGAVVAEVAGEAGFVLVLGHVDHDFGGGGRGAAGEGGGALGHDPQGICGSLGGGAGDLGEFERVGVPAQDLSGHGEVGLVFDAHEAVVFGAEDGVGDQVQPPLEVAVAVDAGGFGEPAALDLFGEPVIGIGGMQGVGEALDGASDIGEPGLPGIVDQQRQGFGPRVGIAFAVQVREQVDMIEADPAVGQGGLQYGLVVQEPGQPGDAEREPRPDPGQIAEAVAVGVGEAAHVDLVDHRVPPPWSVTERMIAHRPSPDADRSPR